MRGHNILLESYKNAHDLHKFYVSFRFKIVAFLATINGALFYFWSAKITTHPTIALVSSVGGVITCWSLMALDRRNKELYDECVRIAKEIEQKSLQKNQGSYTRVYQKATTVTHTKIIRRVSIFGIVLWFILLVVGILFLVGGLVLVPIEII